MLHFIAPFNAKQIPQGSEEQDGYHYTRDRAELEAVVVEALQRNKTLHTLNITKTVVKVTDPMLIAFSENEALTNLKFDLDGVRNIVDLNW